jgi:uncharacterized protein YaiI (UPF0178 family)
MVEETKVFWVDGDSCEILREESHAKAEERKKVMIVTCVI